MEGRKRQVLSLLAALVVSLVHSLAAAAILAPLALVPLVLALRQSELRERLTLALLFGLTFQGWVHNWALSYSVLGWLALTVLKTLPYLLLAFPYKGRGYVFASLWTLSEWVNCLGPLGHTGGSLSLAGVECPLLLQSASLAGPWLLSFLAALCSASVVERDKSSLMMLTLVGVLVFGYGKWRLDSPISSEPPLTVAVVQNCVPRQLKFADPPSPVQIQNLMRLTTEAVGEADLVIWPETAFPGVGLRWNADMAINLGSLARSEQTYLLVGSLEAGDPGFLNTAHLVGTDGRFLARYSKTRLVPFVEYLPEESLRSLPLFERVSQIDSGQESGVLEAGTHRLGVLICWESMTPALARQRTVAGAELLVVTTNDEWFEPGDDVADAHFRMAVLRAVENGRPLAQAANTGISGFIDDRGRVLATCAPGVLAYGTQPLRMGTERTLYTRFGDWFILLLVITLRRRNLEGSTPTGL